MISCASIGSGISHGSMLEVVLGRKQIESSLDKIKLSTDLRRRPAAETDRNTVAMVVESIRH
jgi:hypothetical protein